MITGQESFGEAMIHSTEKMISQMAKQWAEYFAAKAMVDIWTDPPLGAAEIAAAVALEAISGVLGSLASGTKSTSSASDKSAGPSVDKFAPANQPEQQPVTTTNVQHFEQGGLIPYPMLAMIGETREVIVPLDRDSRAIDEIADRIAMRIGGGGAGGDVIHNWNIQGMISADNMQKVAQRLSRGVGKGQMRLLASNSIRVTRRS
jgi:hypothetical protein